MVRYFFYGFIFLFYYGIVKTKKKLIDTGVTLVRLTTTVPENLNLSFYDKQQLLAELGKSLPRSVEEQNIWKADPNPAIAKLENQFYEFLSLPLWYSMEALFNFLGLEKPVTEGFEKSLNRERLAYKVDAEKLKETVIYIPINRLEFPYQTEKAFVDEKIKSMVTVIKSMQELPPVVIGYSYDVHDGHHRVEASRRLGLSHVPCIVRGLKIKKVRTAEHAYQELYKAFCFFDGDVLVAVDFLKKSVWNEQEHPRDAKGRFTTKWGRAVGIGYDLKKIRSTYRNDLKAGGLQRERVTALVVGLIDKGCFRIGHDVSIDDGVFGISTLQRQHIRVSGSKIHFNFTGKKGVPQSHVVQDKLLAEAMQDVLNVKEKPKKPGGKRDSDEVFCYYNTKGQLRTVSNYVINNYLSRWGITAKDFRTYHASRLTFEGLNKRPRPRDLGKRKEVLEAVIKETAKKLGHEPRTAKRSYIDPQIMELYLKGRFKKSVDTSDTSEYTWGDYAEMFDIWDSENGETVEKSLDDLTEKLRSKVRKGFQRRLGYSPDGAVYTKKQLQNMEKLLRDFNVSYYDYIKELKVKGLVTGKVLDYLLQGETIDPDDIPVSLKAVIKPFTLRGDMGTDIKVLPLQSQEIEAIKWAELYAGENIRSKQNDFISGVKRLVVDARRQRLPEGKLRQQLFDEFGGLNRDWRRISVTELAESINTGYLTTLSEGDYVVGQSAVDPCVKCKELVAGKVYQFTKEPGNPDKQIWVGKNNVGKRRRDWKAAVIMHPHCRCRWSRINTKFFKVVDGKVVLKTREEVLSGGAV